MPERDRQIEKERGREEGREEKWVRLSNASPPLLASKHSQTDHVQRVHFTLRLCKTRPGDDTGMADCDPKRSRGITWYCIIQYDLIRRCKFQKILSLSLPSPSMTHPVHLCLLHGQATSISNQIRFRRRVFSFFFHARKYRVSSLSLSFSFFLERIRIETRPILNRVCELESSDII